MSLHKSLKLKNELVRSRNVLSRAERLAAMKERGIWQEGRSVMGLPKLRLKTRAVKKKKKETPEEDKVAEETTEGEASDEKKK